jgi:hypothetical protein
MKHLIWLFLLLALSLTSCMQSAMQKGPDPAAEVMLTSSDTLWVPESTTPEQVENFDPFSLPRKDLFYEALETESLVVEDDLPLEELEDRGGFQVQLIATPQAELAEDMSNQAKMLFPAQPVVMVFDPPNYKVRIGKAVSREMAEELKRQAMRLGYTEAWVVHRKAD